MDNYELLYTLRNITKLSLVDKLKIYKACKRADETRNMISRNDPAHCYSADYTEAINLEIKLRIKALKYELYDEWIAYTKTENDGFTLEQYIQRYIKDSIDNNPKNIKK